MPRIAQRRWNMGRRRRFRANRSADGATAVVMRSGLGDAHDRFGPDLRFGAMARRAPLDDAWRSLPHVRAGRSDVHRPVRDCPGPFRDLPRPRGLAARRRGPPAFCGAGVSRLLAVRLPGRWLCSVPVHSLRIGSTGRVLLQGSGLLSQVRWSPHGRTLRAFGRSCLPRRAGPPVGAQSAASVAVPAGVGSRSLSAGQRRGRADGARIPPTPANGMPPLRVSSIHLHGGVDAVERGPGRRGL